jgi:regulator of protease activity HflC (stomatin/prohibitin superfamily)
MSAADREVRMTSEHGDSNATWGEGPNDSEQDQQPDISSTTAPPDQQGLVIPPSEPDVVEPPQDTRFSGKDRFSQIIRRFSPVLVPLPFAILIFLFTLPFILRGQATLPALPLAVLLIALVILQGTLLYYAGSNDTYWTLFVIIGYALFLVVGTLAIFGFGASLILLVIFLIIGILLARRSILQVPEGYVDIVMMYGRYARTLYPGPNLKMPLEKVSSRLSTKEITWTCPEQVVKISRDEDVKLVATISYKLLPEDAHLASLQVDDWETSLQKLFVSTTQSVINELTPSDFMNWPQGISPQTLVDINSIDTATITRWDHVNDMLAKRIQDQVEKWGVQINYVRIQDVTLIPHLASSMNPVVGMAWRQAAVDVGATRGGYPTVAQPQQAQIVAKPVENQPVPMSIQPSYVPAPVSAASIEMLKDSYEAVRTGRLSDPQTIRDIAARFEALTNDPNIDVDALKAAQILYHRAWIYEQKAKEQNRVGVTSDSVIQPDINKHSQTNDNIYSGG